MHAVLVSVSEATAGGAFDASASTSATTLSLYDVSDFDEAGGSVLINGTVYVYDAVDMDADTIHLATGLTAGVSVDDRADLWDTDYSVRMTEYTALVTVDGQQDGDPLTVDVDHSLSTLLAAGTFASGQSVTVLEDGDGYTLTKVHGKNNQGTQRSDNAGLSYGVDMGDGTVAGLQVNPSGTTVRVSTLTEARVKTPDALTFKPILASAFTVSSDSKVKTKPTTAPDALAIIAGAPAKHWRYLTDEAGVQRIGPMADDLPDWMQHLIVEDDPAETHLGTDLARANGVLWRAVEQLAEMNRDLTARVEALEHPSPRKG